MIKYKFPWSRGSWSHGVIGTISLAENALTEDHGSQLRV